MKESANIFGSIRRDISYLYLFPTIIVIGMMSFDRLYENPLVAFLALFVFDTGHRYTTAFRTYFHKEELEGKPRYVIAPLIVYSSVFFWAYMGVPYFWSVIVYMTFYHHIRQYYGVYRWYAKLDDYKVKNDDWHLYAVIVIPFLLFHLRSVEYQSLYDYSEILFFPNDTIFKYAVISYTVYFACILFVMTRKLLHKNIGTGTYLAFVYPGVLHYICFLFFNHSYQILIPVLGIHGLTYLFIINKSVHRIKPVPQNPYKVWIYILGLVFIFAGLEYLMMDHTDIFKGKIMQGNIFLCSLVALYLLPNILHYYYDGFLWKKEHRDFAKIMK